MDIQEWEVLALLGEDMSYWKALEYAETQQHTAVMNEAGITVRDIERIRIG